MTWPGLGGLQPPPGNAPAAGTLVPGVTPGVTPGVVLAQYVIVFGAKGGVFVYSGTPALGNPPIFWATSASTDPYGNVIPSTVGVAGSGTFEAGDTIINANGVFVYSGTPSSSNLIASICPTATTDPFGTSTAQGFAAYETGISGGTYIVTLGQSNGTAGLVLTAAVSGPTTSPVIGSAAASSLGTGAVIYSGTATGAATSASLQVLDSVFSSIAHGLIELQAGQISFGFANGANNYYNDSNQTLNMQNVDIAAGGGPFIGGESFHSVSLPAGYSGTLRVKLLPWNAVWLDLLLTAWPTTAGAATGGSLPSAAYYPTSTRVFPMTLNGTITSVSNAPRVFVPTSGGVQLIVPTNTNGSPAVGGCSVMYPTN